MRKLLSLLFIASLSLTLTACYHPDLQQGNDYTPEQFDKLKTGMSKARVVEIMGDPVLTDTFDDNQMTYVYTNKPNHGKLIQRSVVLTFKNDHLVKIDRQDGFASRKISKTPIPLKAMPPMETRTGQVADDKPEVTIP